MPIGSSTSKKKSINTKWDQNPNNQARRFHGALSGPARDAATRATRVRGRRALAPTRLQRCGPDQAPSAAGTHPRAARRGPRASAHHGPHAARAARGVIERTGNPEFSARLQCPRTRRDGRDCLEPQLSAPPRRRRVVRNDAPRGDDEADDAPRGASLRTTCLLYTSPSPRD